MAELTSLWDGDTTSEALADDACQVAVVFMAAYLALDVLLSTRVRLTSL